MVFIHKGYQGEIGSIKSKDGTERQIQVYQNSSDFPESHMLLMPSVNWKETERVPITEELWQIIGECLGYKFQRVKEKNR